MSITVDVDFKKNLNRTLFCCCTEQTGIHQSRACKDNEYHTCRLPLASSTESHLKNCYTRTMKCRTQRGVCCCVPRRRNTTLCLGAEAHNFNSTLTPEVLSLSDSDFQRTKQV